MRYICIPITIFSVVFFFTPTVYAANTHAIDLELSSSQYLSRADNAALELSGDFTIELWIKAESWTANSSYLITKDAASTNGWAFYTQANGNSPVFQSNAANNHIFNTVTLSTATCYYLAVVQSGTNIKGYIGTTTTSLSQFMDTTYTEHGTAGTQEFRIGRPTSQTVRFFDGTVDEVRMWSTAKSKADLEAGLTTELTGSETNLVALWHLDNALTDSGPNSLTLTNNGSAAYASSGLCFSPSAGGGGTPANFGDFTTFE